MKKKTDIYHRWVAWSDEDQLYIGRCPDLFGGGVHGKDPIKVARELQQVIDEWEEIHEQDNRPLPPRPRPAHRRVRLTPLPACHCTARFPKSARS